MLIFNLFLKCKWPPVKYHQIVTLALTCILNENGRRPLSSMGYKVEKYIFTTITNAYSQLLDISMSNATQAETNVVISRYLSLVA